ncbi:MAG: LysR family transcriptional regulator [Desulfobacterales bacterium]|uniref:LysR family transcriptional regulator n=1 Tax=Candidatus Desulfatibia profunda TaxID=2841695 RepID=A0A8J6NPY1_9BACT|nr:LysR family transcriptional regulator [Candidatus Desulfatibia profunda]MBL7180634.1 LysR family transcriptional regulator [Desulfobacterales bacterium]
MEIRQLRTFQTVARLLSFNRAAEHLHYAQSSISAQIQSLEEELGVQLFDRLGRGILLTEAGKRLLQYAEKILDLADQTRSEVAGARELTGSLTIKMPETLGVHRLPPVIKAFRARFPKVRLSFTSCTHEGLQKDLRKGITDLAFLLAESIQAADLAAEVLGIETLVLVAHPDHRLAAQPVVHARDLKGETILFSKVDCSYRRSLESILDTENIRYDAALEFNSVAAIKQCVMTGVGITVLPEITVAEDISKGRLAALSWAEGTLEVAILMIWYRDRWLSPTLSAFMEIVREVFNET